ncbi:uncharacterized protein LOC112904097 [Agrilus planipennis]|uniref:Uncharacterized protein LOC112904097 n=1 Tax=Agrilus planipennis TaxID=224129 RepID=A0A7F5QVL4_AGRPL|nr:uncharacterized protein LOC112904097 [Agrilus planipennis]
MNLERFISTFQKDYECPGNSALFPPRLTTMDPRAFEMEIDDWMKLPQTREYRETDCTCKLRPSQLLDKLQEKYPPVYEALKRAPPGYLNARVDRDRFKTTHRIDYGNVKPTIIPQHVRDVFKYFEPPEKPPCSTAIDPRDFCQTKPTRARKINGITGPQSEQLNPTILREEIVFPNEKHISPFGGASEYKDGICKIGENIMKENATLKSKGKKKKTKKATPTLEKAKPKKKCESYT